MVSGFGYSARLGNIRRSTRTCSTVPTAWSSFGFAPGSSHKKYVAVYGMRIEMSSRRID